MMVIREIKKALSMLEELNQEEDDLWFKILAEFVDYDEARMMQGISYEFAKLGDFLRCKEYFNKHMELMRELLSEGGRHEPYMKDQFISFENYSSKSFVQGIKIAMEKEDLSKINEEMFGLAGYLYGSSTVMIQKMYEERGIRGTTTFYKHSDNYHKRKI